MDEARLFMVRVWRGAAHFRASVRSVDEDRLHLFADADELARFLARELPPGSPAPGTTPGPPAAVA